MPKLIFVVAYSQNRAIGIHNTLPWHLPNDFKHFKSLTLGQTILMGRKTYASIGKLLAERKMIVLSRKPDFHSPYAQVISSFETLLPLQNDLYIIGGAEIYKTLLPKAEVIYATEVQTSTPGDVFFPELDPNKWREVSRQKNPPDERHAFAYDFVEYHRIMRT